MIRNVAPPEKNGAIASVRAVRRALSILRAFEGQAPLSLAQITALTGLDKGTARRILLTLCAEGFVAQDPVTQRYGLGRIIRTLASGAAFVSDLRAAALPVLTELASELRSTAFLSVFEDYQAICLERVHDLTGIEVRWWTVGGALPFGSGGAPKLLLAYQEEAAVARVLQGPLLALTPHSIIDQVALVARLRLIRERGWELAVDDVVVGLTALAAPVFDSAGRFVCAVSVAGLTPQMVDEDGRPRHLGSLLRAAESLSARLTT